MLGYLWLVGKLTIWCSSVESGFFFWRADKERGTTCTSCSDCYWMAGKMLVVFFPAERKKKLKYRWSYNALCSKWLAWPNKRRCTSCITPEKFASSKSTRFRYIAMHIKEGKTIKGFCSAYFLLGAVNLHPKKPDKSKEWYLFLLWADGKFAIDCKLGTDIWILGGRKRCV